MLFLNYIDVKNKLKQKEYNLWSHLPNEGESSGLATQCQGWTLFIGKKIAYIQVKQYTK